MTKQKLLKRIELLEARVAVLESRPLGYWMPYTGTPPYIGTPIIWGETTSGSIGPPQVLPFN